MTTQNHSPSTSTRHVLLAEDDTAFRALLARLLRVRGFLVTEAKDGEELLELFAAPLERQEPGPCFDVILSDVQMPKFTALDVMLATRRVRSSTKVVLMTAFGGETVRNMAMQSGALCVLEKPCSLLDVCSLLESLVGEDAYEAPVAPSLAPSQGL